MTKEEILSKHTGAGLEWLKFGGLFGPQCLDAMQEFVEQETALKNKEIETLSDQNTQLFYEISRLKEIEKALKKAEVILNNAANMCENSILKNAILLSLSSLNLPELLNEQPK